MKSAGLLIAVGLIGCKARETSAPAEPPRQAAPAADSDAIADDELMRDARVVPEMRDGAVIGFRFQGVREGTTIAKLGLHNGDVLTAYNGQPLTSAEIALNFYSALKSGDPIKLDIIRDGKPMTLEPSK